MQWVATQGIKITCADERQAVTLISQVAAAQQTSHVHLINAYSLVCASRSPVVLASLDSSTALNLADGNSMKLARMFLHGRSAPISRGPSIFEAMLLTHKNQFRHFLYGSSPSTLRQIVNRVAAQAPDTAIVGVISPPFRSLTDDEWSDHVQIMSDARPDIIWIGLGTPKQDVWAAKIAAELGILTVSVGAAFDFLSGMKPEAPRIMQKAKLEWLFRLATEPRRMWRRYSLDSISFFSLLLRERFGGVSQRRHSGRA